eukprot:3242524-Amphidinium_carterae.2
MPLVNCEYASEFRRDTIFLGTHAIAQIHARVCACQAPLSLSRLIKNMENKDSCHHMMEVLAPESQV